MKLAIFDMDGTLVDSLMLWDVFWREFGERFLNGQANEAWVFEDSLVALKTAKKAGFQTVGVFDKHHDNWVQVKEVSKVFIDDGETMMKLIGEHV